MYEVLVMLLAYPELGLIIVSQAALGVFAYYGATTYLRERGWIPIESAVKLDEIEEAPQPEPDPNQILQLPIDELVWATDDALSCLSALDESK